MKAINGMPALGFGTWARKGDDGQAAIEYALEVGYRHIDTAQSYDTEAECGRAVRASGLPRSDVFLTTKIAPDNFGAGKLGPSLEASLRELQLEHADLTLIHWPSPGGDVAMEVYLEQLAQARQDGLTTHIGVSNFPIALVDQARALLGDVPIFCNQFELNPYLQNSKLARHCQSLGIAVTCYCPVSAGEFDDDPVMSAIATAHEATANQIALAFELSKGYATIPTSSNHDRIRSNFGALDIELTEAEMTQITTLDRGKRRVNPEWGPNWD